VVNARGATANRRVDRDAVGDDNKVSCCDDGRNAKPCVETFLTQMQSNVLCSYGLCLIQYALVSNTTLL